MYFTVDDRTYALDEVPVRAERSKTFDIAVEEAPKLKKVNIPAKDHPWNLLYTAVKTKASLFKKKNARSRHS